MEYTKEKDPNKSYDSDGKWDWRKDMGVPPEKIYNIVFTRPDGEKFAVENGKNEISIVRTKLGKTILRLFKSGDSLLCRISKENNDRKREIIIKFNEDVVILKKIQTRIKNLIKESGLNIVMEEQTREYLFTDKFYGK